MSLDDIGFDCDLKTLLSCPGALRQFANDNNMTVEQVVIEFSDALDRGIKTVSELNKEIQND